MNLWFRLIWMLLKRPWRKPADPFSTTVVRMRVWPLDLDLNRHVTNGRYFTLADLGRMDYVLKTGAFRTAMRHKADGTPLVVIAGKEYGTGSSRDWAAKGTNLLGVRAVIVESFERIHRSNLVGMGVLPLQFMEGQDRNSLGLKGDDSFTITSVSNLQPRQTVTVHVTRKDGSTFTFDTLCRIDTANEIEYFMNGGILHYVLRKLAA